MEKYDVIVSGAGCAGFGAALGAARLGKKVLIFDSNAAPGGTAVFAGCPVFTGGGDPGERKGAFKDFMEAVGSRYTAPAGNATCNMAEADITLAMTRLLKAAGVDMLFYATLIDAHVAGDRIRSVTLFCCGQKLVFEAACFVDATGDALLADLAGAPTVTGSTEDSMTKTLLFRVSGVTHFDKPLLKKLFPTLDFPYPWQDNFMGTPVGSDGKDILINLSAVSGKALDPFDRTRMDMELREQAETILQWLRQKLPGFENCRLSAVAPQMGVRNSRNIIAREQITCDDLDNDTPVKEGIARGKRFYGDHFIRGFANPKSQFAGTLRLVPYGALLPQKISNLSVGGRCIGTEPRAASAIRLAPCCMATGQAAGIAAALGIPAYSVLKKELENQNML